MPLAPGIHQYFGLGLYNSAVGLAVVEGLLWVIGIALYPRATRSRGRTGIFVLWLGLGILTFLWIGSFDPTPPPSVHGVIVVNGVAFPIMLAWFYWVDYFREPVSTFVSTANSRT